MGSDAAGGPRKLLVTKNGLLNWGKSNSLALRTEQSSQLLKLLNMPFM